MSLTESFLWWDMKPELHDILRSGMRSQLKGHEFESQSGFWLSSSPGTWVQAPIWVAWFQAGALSLLLLFSHSAVSNSLQPHGLQHARLPCPSPSSRPCSNSCPLSRDAIQSSHPLSSPSPPALNLSQHQSLFQWVSSSNQVAKVLEFQFQHQSFQWIFRIYFLLRTDWFDLSILKEVLSHKRLIVL